jgi:outer membrane receptor protein involved in Fe transport
VLDESGAPVAAAAVQVESAPGMVEAVRVTPDDGAFALEVSPGRTLVVRCLGFKEWRRTWASGDSTASIEIRLESSILSISGIEVTAYRRPVRTAEITSPTSRLTGSRLTGFVSGMPSLAERLAQTPEVSTIGRDAYNAAPAVRGLARFRTVVLLDGARIHSDREIGPSAGFVDPATLESVEIVRGPGSMLYGSDAIGGVISLKPFRGAARAPGGWIETGWSSANRGARSASGGVVPLGAARLAASAAHASAGDYALPGASAFPWSRDLSRATNSGFERSTGHARLTWGELEASSFYSLGTDIGRPAREDEVFSVAREEHVLHTAAWTPHAGATPLELRASIHPARWTATVEEPNGSGSRFQERRYRSLDWGALVTAAPRRGATSLLLGAQADARSGVRIYRAMHDRDSTGAETSYRLDRWVDDVSTGQAGLFAHALTARDRTRIAAGARLDWTWRRGSTRDGGRAVATGQIGLTREAGAGVLFTANLATAFREPNVTELFFSGKRPAGYVEGNPDLEPERSYHLDVGARWVSGPAEVALSAFGLAIRDFIALRLRPGSAAPETLAFANSDRVRLGGAQLEITPRGTWHGMTGRLMLDLVLGSDADGAPISDLHAPRARVEWAWERGSLSARGSWRATLAHRHVGPSESPIPGHGVADAGIAIRSGFARFSLAVQNLLDQEYFERAEPLSYPAPGRSLLLSIRIER